MSARPKEASRTQRARYIAVLVTLKAQDCITGYTITGQEVTPEWKEGGAERALQELENNPKPFGLRRTQGAELLMLLPFEHRQRFDATLVRGLRARYGL